MKEVPTTAILTWHLNLTHGHLITISIYYALKGILLPTTHNTIPYHYTRQKGFSF